MTDYKENMDIQLIENETLRQIAEIIGLEALFQVLELIGGNNFYFPKAESVTRDIRNQQIINECNGYNFREVARKYNLTVNWIQKLYTDYKREQEGPVPDQITFF